MMMKFSPVDQDSLQDEITKFSDKKDGSLFPKAAVNTNLPISEVFKRPRNFDIGIWAGNYRLEENKTTRKKY